METARVRSIISAGVAVWTIAVMAVHADVNERVAIDIRLRLDQSIAIGQIAADLKREVDAIWEPYGIRVEWTDADAIDAPANPVSLDVKVEREFERVRVGWPLILGHVDLTPAASVWRPIRVSIDATEQALSERTTGRSTGPGPVLDRHMAVALGRVLAHEIGHVLLGPPFHDRAGLMRAALQPNELGEPDRAPFRLTCSGVVRLRNRLRALMGDPQLDPLGAPCIEVKTAR